MGVKSFTNAKALNNFGLAIDELFESPSDDDENALGSFITNGTLVPPSYSVVLYPDRGEITGDDPHAP